MDLRPRDDLIADRMGNTPLARAVQTGSIRPSRPVRGFNPDVIVPIFDRRIREEQAATMASKTLKANDGGTGRRPTSPPSPSDVPTVAPNWVNPNSAHPELVEGRNPGTRRTASKRALLKAIEDAGGKW